MTRKHEHYGQEGAPRHLTADGLTWLDPNRQPPQLDERGRLLRRFTLVDDEGRHEHWAAGMRLPYTSRQWELVTDALERARKGAKDHLLSQADTARIVEEVMAANRPAPAAPADTGKPIQEVLAGLT